MTTRQHARRSAGFTLIELLIVVGIMAVLAAVAVGTYFRIQSGQQTRNTEARLAQINTALNRIWSANRDQADSEFRSRSLPSGNSYDSLLAVCGGDADRAKSVWMYLRLKNEFPQTFLEAINPTTLSVSISGNTFSFSLPARRTFTANATINGTTGAPVNDAAGQNEAAALLYMIVTEKASRGEEYGDLGTGAGAVDLQYLPTSTKITQPGTFRTFRDSWGTPIAFARFATSPEINAAPFAKTSAGGNNDPLDPRGKLSTNAGSWSSVGALVAPQIFGTATTNFTAVNWLITAYSAGPDKNYDANPTPISSPSNGPTVLVISSDDILGYRLRREGQRGD